MAWLLYVSLCLIVEDPDERARVQRNLSTEFPTIQFREITGPVQYEQALARGGFDLVITDYSLSWSNGIAIMAEVKERYPNTPVIMLVPAEQETIALEAMKAGLDDYVVRHKDWDPSLRLQAVILSTFERAEIRRHALLFENRLEQLYETMHLATYTTTAQGQLLEANQAFLTLLGIEKIAADQPIFWRDSFVRPQDYEELRQRIHATRETQIRTVLLHRSQAAPISVRLWEMLVNQLDEAAIVAGYLQAQNDQQYPEMLAPDKDVAQNRLPLLTPREKEVMEMVVSGMTNKLIAGKLQISMKTVEMHRSHLMKKLRVNSVADLVRVALRAKSVRDDR